MRPPPRSPLFPYTTLFRSRAGAVVAIESLQTGARRECHNRRGHRFVRSEEHTSELQSRGHLVCRLLLEKKKKEHLLLWILKQPPILIRYNSDHQGGLTSLS